MNTDTREALAALPTDAQVVAAARVLNKRAAEACNVDEEDSWKTYGEEYKDDAREALRAALATQPAQPSAQSMNGWKPGLEPDDTDKRAVRFIGTDPLDIAANATLPMVAESWRFGFRLNDDMTLTFTLMDEGPLVAYAAVAQPSAQGEAVPWCARWIRNNYQDHPNIDSLCEAMLASAPAAPAQSVPLMDEQIDLIANDGRRNAAGGIYSTRVYEFARAIERAHGIKAAP